MNTLEPVAMMMLAPVMLLPSTDRVWVSANEAIPSTTVTLLPRSRPLTPLTRVLTTAFFLACKAAISTAILSASTPVTAKRAASFTLWYTSAV